ncbi:MAG: hypothetical protein KKE30_08260 [Gammaproteobacteria bacterium]|nr:hypothetical protein [Gammaproteobacteria bacterium]MBU1555012.1 hypothetical protein [Gammaproteobacteria bacterium]MBU2071019.1 hypothetical protein [Gammaproteobacteria bacterium]MBU2184287.1 hypothetical protein [Gammaproteobacteria bacterium]MBU2206456.1 hypothetical protein [Gammaproteobacteria bacterium]
MLSIQCSSWQDFSRLSRLVKQQAASPADYARLVADYCCCSCRLASLLASEKNILLQEWCLRYALFTLADIAADPRCQTTARTLCLNNLYVPLRALIRYYQQQPQGRADIAALHAKLRHCLAMM